MGRKLWEAIGITKKLAKAKQTIGSDVLPVIIQSEAASVHRLPWETLFTPEYGFLGARENFTVSRSINTGNANLPPLEKGPLRALLFTSLPDDIDAERSRLNIEDEQAQMWAALLPWIHSGHVLLETPDDGQLATLEELLGSFQPHLVILSGHGKFSSSPLRDEKSTATFLFETQDGAGDPVDEDRIAEIFREKRVACLVLSACESARSEVDNTEASSGELINGLAWSLSRAGIPHVIGMRESIMDRAGTLFSRAFIDSLIRRERVDLAVQKGRRAITQPLKDDPLYAGDKTGLAALSLGQWCLPTLITSDPSRPVIDWNFQARPLENNRENEIGINPDLNGIAPPQRFTGRRSVLRSLKNRIKRRELRSLLITGPGGQGKTTLAGKLAQDLEAQGYRIIAYCLRPGISNQSLFDAAFLSLNKLNRDTYNARVIKLESEQARREYLLKLLLAEHSRVVFFIDNLETSQDLRTRVILDENIRTWMEATTKIAGAPTGDTDFLILLTSRYLIPDWPPENHLDLARLHYGDFLRIAQSTNLPLKYFRERTYLRRVYKVLNGNGRGLHFFAQAIGHVDEEGEAHFIESLSKARKEIQTDMMIDLLVQQLEPDTLSFLEVLPAFLTPVPSEGLAYLCSELNLSRPVADLLERLAALSLIESGYNRHWKVMEYRISPLVADRLAAKKEINVDLALRKKAADYQENLFKAKRDTQEQALIVHAALKFANERERANRFAIEWVVAGMARDGLSQTLLDEWLPEICESENRDTRANALNQASLQYRRLGNYRDARAHAEKALEIAREESDLTLEGVVLNNLALALQDQGEHERALETFQEALEIQRGENFEPGVSITLNNIAQLHSELGNFKKAKVFFTESLALLLEKEDKINEAFTLANLGSLALQSEGAKEALAYYERALGVLRPGGYRREESDVLVNISQVYAQMGEVEHAFELLEDALKIKRSIKEPAGESAILVNKGALYLHFGDNELALGFFKEALTIRREIKDLLGEGEVLNNIGALYDRENRLDLAEQNLTEALKIRRLIGDQAGEAITLNNIALVHKQKGKLDRAQSYFNDALHIQQSINEKPGQIRTLNNLSELYDELENLESALFYNEESMSVAGEIQDEPGLCIAIFNRGGLLYQKGEHEKAGNAWVRSYRMAKKMNLAQILTDLTNLANQMGRPEGLTLWEELSGQKPDELDF